jgi:hypothetical protein
MGLCQSRGGINEHFIPCANTKDLPSSTFHTTASASTFSSNVFSSEDHLASKQETSQPAKKQRRPGLISSTQPRIEDSQNESLIGDDGKAVSRGADRRLSSNEPKEGTRSCRSSDSKRSVTSGKRRATCPAQTTSLGGLDFTKCFLSKSEPFARPALGPRTERTRGVFLAPARQKSRLRY